MLVVVPPVDVVDDSFVRRNKKPAPIQKPAARPAPKGKHLQLFRLERASIPQLLMPLMCSEDVQNILKSPRREVVRSSASRASYTPLFGGRSHRIPQGMMILDVQPLVKSLFCPIKQSPNGVFDSEALPIPGRPFEASFAGETRILGPRLHRIGCLRPVPPARLGCWGLAHIGEAV